jgi:alkylation response protein AidB-like acyl-CoA dehydrogenase
LLRPTFEKAVTAGFLKGLIPVPFGGAASSGVDAAILIGKWAAVSPDFVISMPGPLIALTPVYQVGTPEQIERFVRPFLADEEPRWLRWPSASRKAAPTLTPTVPAKESGPPPSSTVTSG